MTLLLVDIGNTRLKFARYGGGRLDAQRSVAHAGRDAADWSRELFDGGPVDRVIAACVAGPAAETALRAAASTAGVDAVEFVRASAHAAGVHNGYADPAQLGVDRWLALIAAHHGWPGPCCVIDVGTAATIDVLDGGGRHLGGFIVPGPMLMTGSLLHGTGELALRSARPSTGDAGFFANNTRDAIERGSRVALASLAERSAAELRHLSGVEPRMLLTGGAGPELQAWIASPVELVPDLVLRGLAVLATAPDAVAG